MSFSNIYPNLPGMLVNFKDGGMVLRQDINTEKTDSMLIVGTSQDGPVLEPIAVDDSSVEVVFGKAVNENGISNGTLVKAYKQARKRGCNDIRLMRVTGTNASAVLTGQELSISETKRIEEKICTVSGNTSSTFTLTKQNILQGTVKVFVKGSELLTGFEANVDNGTVVIHSGVTDAGAPVTIQYSYKEQRTIKDEVYTVKANKVTLKNIPVSITSIKQGETLIEATKYTVTNSEIVFTEEAGLIENDQIAITYEYITPKIDVTENGNGETLFITGTEDITYELTNAPKNGSVKLYIDGVMNSDNSIVNVDYETKTVTVGKEHFKKGSTIIVEYAYDISDSICSEIKFESFFGGAVYNQGSVDVSEIKNEANEIIGKLITITKPVTKKLSSIETPLVYSSIDYPTFGSLIEGINKDVNNGLYKASTSSPDILTKDLTLTDKIYFAGGLDGINVSKQEMYEALCGKRNDEGFLEVQGAFQLLEDYLVDWIVPVGVYADDELDLRGQNFAYELGLLCAVLSYRNKTTLGAIAMKPNRDTSLLGVQEYAKQVATFNNVFLMKDANGSIIKDADGNPLDLGKFLSVVAGPEIKAHDISVGTFMCNPAVDYAAMNTPLLPQSSPTNKAVVGANELSFNFSYAQLDKITGNRIITFKSRTERNGKKSIIVVDGVTSALPSSDYTRITTPKVTRYTVDSIREVAEPFLGEPSTIEQRNALSAQISKRLSILREKGVIVDSVFQLVTTAQDQLLGNAQIELSIIPPQELRKITAIVGLKPSL